MLTVEVLPNTSAHAQPGWAYVPDTGYDPSKAPIVPSGARKRTRESTGIGGGATALQRLNKAVALRLANLEKENYKDTPIPVPARARPASRKLTPNVRRILQAQRTFTHYLDAEEALSTQQPSAPTTTTASTLHRTGSLKGATTTSTISIPSSSNRKAPSRPEFKTEDAPAPTTTTNLPPSGAAALTYDPNADPLLKTHIPLPPSTRVLDALLSEPALSFTAARARPSSLGTPARHFCEDCGYWGRVRCRKCGARTCGLMGCYIGHETTRCIYK